MTTQAERTAMANLRHARVERIRENRRTNQLARDLYTALDQAQTALVNLSSHVEILDSIPGIDRDEYFEIIADQNVDAALLERMQARAARIIRNTNEDTV